MAQNREGPDEISLYEEYQRIKTFADWKKLTQTYIALCMYLNKLHADLNEVYNNSDFDYKLFFEKSKTYPFKRLLEEYANDTESKGEGYIIKIKNAISRVVSRRNNLMMRNLLNLDLSSQIIFFLSKNDREMIRCLHDDFLWILQAEPKKDDDGYQNGKKKDQENDQLSKTETCSTPDEERKVKIKNEVYMILNNMNLCEWNKSEDIPKIKTLLQELVWDPRVSIRDPTISTISNEMNLLFRGINPFSNINNLSLYKSFISEIVHPDIIIMIPLVIEINKDMEFMITMPVQFLAYMELEYSPV